MKNKLPSIFLTELKAIDPLDGELKTYSGPNIVAYTWLQAEQACIDKYPYLKVIGKYVEQINITDDIIVIDINLN